MRYNGSIMTLYDKQQDWLVRMNANIDNMTKQFRTNRKVDVNLLAETSRKVLEASRRLSLKHHFRVVSEEDFASFNEWFDGEALVRLEWLKEHLRVIAIYTHEEDGPEPDFELMYEREMDRRYHQLHGNIPRWAE